MFSIPNCFFSEKHLATQRLLASQNQPFALQVRLNRVLYCGMPARLRSQSDTMRLQLITLSLPKVALQTVTLQRVAGSKLDTPFYAVDETILCPSLRLFDDR